MSGLHAELDAPLPDALVGGRPTALHVGGWCVAPAGRIVGLELAVDGGARPVEAFGTPRLDVFHALHPGVDPTVTDDPASPADPGLHGYRSGFWGTIRLAGPGPWAVTLRGRLADGTTVETALGTIGTERLPAPLPDPSVGAGDAPLVAVCMATYDPPEGLFERQLASIRAQTHEHWVLVIADDGSRPERLAAIRSAVGDDERVTVVEGERRLGFYRNFERALALAPAAAAFVAPADQDDDWHPDKLLTLLAAVGERSLAYSDARVVRTDGTVVAETYWGTRRNNHDDLLSLLVANAVTGAASVLRRDLLADALPFPPAQFAHFHDHWLGLVARATGGIAYVDRPLYDYVQHGDASLGHAAANRMPALRDRVAALRRDPRERVRLWRMHYFVDVRRLVVLATILLDRLGPRMTRGDRRTLERFVATDGSVPGLLRLFGRGARELLRSRPETLGAEWMLAHGFLWRRLLDATTRERPQRGVRLDAVPPPSLALAPGRSAAELPAIRDVEEKVRPLAVGVDAGAPVRVNLLIPAIDLDHLFGGYIGKFNLARRLAERGHRVRLVTVDPGAPLPPDWRSRVQAYAGLDGLFDRVEVADGRAPGGLAVSRDDAWIATTWWTAHVADAAVRAAGGTRRGFLYLIQEYEPFTFPMGTWAALAEASYRLEHRALFSTDLLRDWFRMTGTGVYTAGAGLGDAASVAFSNAITDPVVPDAAELSARRVRRLLFYARPEPHAARNLFELGALAIKRAHETGALAGWELRGVGTTALGRTLSLGGGATLQLIQRSAQADWATLLPQHDVGLALMHTPHPSLVPIEMAAAGLRTVTSTFAPKDAAAMAAISPNLVAVQPTVDAVAQALAAAAAGASDGPARVAGAGVHWPRDWDAAFDNGLLERVEGLLGLRD